MAAYPADDALGIGEGRSSAEIWGGERSQVIESAVTDTAEEVEQTPTASTSMQTLRPATPTTARAVQLSPTAETKLTLPEAVHAAIGADSEGSASLPVVLGIAVVDFNHLVGPQIEYAHPPEIAQDEDISNSLPFLALPDGSHLSDEDFCYFHLLSRRILPESTIFGISCNRQIASDKLAVKGKEVTRGTVQKAVVVLAREPVFGPIREKLGVVTRAFFAQGDLQDTHILVDFHATLESGLSVARGAPMNRRRPSGSVDGHSTADSVPASGTVTPDPAQAALDHAAEVEKEAVMYMGTSLRELVFKWRFKTLMLLKLLLLQRKVMFFGYPVERLCTYQYSLVSMVPGLLLALDDAGSPDMRTHSGPRPKAESLRTSDRKSLLRFMGLPLTLFGSGAFFQPYLPLQQLDMASKASSFLVGTTNSIFRQQKECRIDVIVDLEQSNLEFLDPKLQQIVNLTAADRKWMDELVHVVTESWNPADPSRPITMQYVGSDDYLRAKFEDYICSMLSTVKYTDFLVKGEKQGVSISAPDAAVVASFGTDFISGFKQTSAYALWDAATDPMIFDLFEHKHPCEGKVSALEDVGLRVQAGLHDLHLEEQLAPTREAIGNALQSGGATAWRIANKFGNDLAKFRREQMAKAEAAAAAKAAGSPSATSTSRTSAETARTDDGKHQSVDWSKSGETTSTAAASAPPTSPRSQEIQAQAAAAAASAGETVRAAWGSFGSFLSSRQKAWSAASPSDGPAPTANKSEVPRSGAAPSSGSTYPPTSAAALAEVSRDSTARDSATSLRSSSSKRDSVAELAAAPTLRSGPMARRIASNLAESTSGSSTPSSSSPQGIDASRRNSSAVGSSLVGGSVIPIGSSSRPASASFASPSAHSTSASVVGGAPGGRASLLNMHPSSPAARRDAARAAAAASSDTSSITSSPLAASSTAASRTNTPRSYVKSSGTGTGYITPPITSNKEEPRADSLSGDGQHSTRPSSVEEARMPAETFTTQEQKADDAAADSHEGSKLPSLTDQE
ncbi:hypothetical protein IE81DRAFT_346821 [Ceraceosorus guamensis]|uniref:UDENN domain-containing protein n=1 Tax=Ceraceosorus guamensis TaxID=1522189 RepID=A0A316VZY2_9BASI|nr:hypothetical protein IE81DRAFT_346821 [Ceraceosorus guamensis]PWN43227.1 hypothetical protein IE81DRAFT_346821 [Ceraceosorus guamensis]